ncbi:MAG: metal-dependent hydrolase [Myxococcota bacterium]
MDTITVRQMSLAFPDDMDPVVVPGKPEESFFFLAFSLLLPYLEPYLIRTMKEARRHVTDEALLEDLGKFNAQEGQHYKQHARFNEIVRAQGFPELLAIEKDLDDDYQRFSREKALRFNLAYAEGFEAFTTAMARVSFERGMDEMHPALRELYTWHLVEEFEHRTVAFDVYEHVVGDYLYRLRVGLFAQWHMLRWCLRAQRYMLGADRGLLERHGGAAGRRRRAWEQIRTRAPKLLARVLPTYTPWYTPHRIEMPEGMQALQDRYDAMALRLL